MKAASSATISRCLKDLQTLQAARKKEIVETNPKSKLKPIHPIPSEDAGDPGEGGADAPTPDDAPPDAQNKPTQYEVDIFNPSTNHASPLPTPKNPEPTTHRPLP
jgi:hypothetical protein